MGVLEHYLQLNPYMLVFLKHENNIIAESSVNLRSLVPVDTLEEFLKYTAYASTTLHEKCFLNKQDSLEIFNIDNEHKRPYLDIQLKLQYIGNKTDMQNLDTVINSNDNMISIIQYNEESMNVSHVQVEQLEHFVDNFSFHSNYIDT
jgi:hypothetical protein